MNAKECEAKAKECIEIANDLFRKLCRREGDPISLNLQAKQARRDASAWLKKAKECVT